MSGKGKQTVKKSGGKPSAKQTGLKLKETTGNSSKIKETEALEHKELALSFPLLKIGDNARVLPRYTTVLGRSEEEGVGMEDLDTLQLELETLLSAAALRIRALNGEVGALNSTEERKDKKGKTSGSKPLSPGKRGSRTQEERSIKKSKDLAGRANDVPQPPLPLKFTKVKSLPTTPLHQPSTSALPLPDLDIMETPLTDVPAPVIPKNDTPNKFWATVEPYCAEISTSDIQTLKDLIQSQESAAANQTIPPLGRHYSLTWLQEDVNDESLASNPGEKKKRLPGAQYDSPETTSLLKKVEKCPENAVAGPLTQRLVSALLEENILPSKESEDKESKDGENITPSRTGVFNGISLANAVSLEKRVRKELEEQGLLDPEDAPKNEDDDEILAELKRCQGELKKLSEHNAQALKRLLKLSTEEMARQELRRKLSLADLQVSESHKKIMAAKYKKRPLTKKEKEQSWKTLKDRDAILRQLEAYGGGGQK